MKTKELKLKFDQSLKPLGYKKKGNKWSAVTKDLTKIIELQKSSYSNLYYVNYGVNLNGLDYKEILLHVFGRHSNTLNLEITDDETLNRLVNETIVQIINKLAPLNTVEDVISYTKTLPTLNILPLRVKEFLNLK
ncbi:DUF4304 domain-containing protein [Pontibacter sp. 172403-2]|uniref:DUF4304 domain-containing protein n=1 Tax=Pontibacter rufus TaxID=2791028 RepID=UPI0018AFA5AB|nr:DUF4304 domain-containing protein [Pontibacter sp. 172403-2]MBF9254386.1 DUF4304 domain-containing protein [Pontibacter sp. 172403-2]